MASFFRTKTPEHLLVKAAIGMIAGMVATGPMTVAMILWHRRLPSHEKYPLPPREITEHLSDRIGIGDQMNEPEKAAATLLAHFGYGSAAGGLYTFFPITKETPGLASGALFGLLLWAGSYFGLLPATGLLSSAKEHPARRNLLMAGAHAVWGLALGGLVRLFFEEAGEDECRTV
jgi:putative membrane protein